MDREWWLQERKTGIGSSDAAAVCGLSPWSTAYGVYLEKTGQMPDHQPSPAMAWGLRLEPALAEAYSEQTGLAVAKPLPIIRHHEYPWLLASVDRMTDDGRIVELKTASAFNADEWGQPGTDEIPHAYLIQVQHQLMVTGLDVADVAVLLGGQDFRVYTCRRNDRFLRRLFDVEKAFWQLVEHREPPQPDFGHPTTPGLLESLLIPEEGTEVELTEDDLAMATGYEACKASAANAEKLARQAKAHLLARMGTAALGRLPDGRQIVRRRVSVRGHTVQQHDYTSFRIQHKRED